MSQNKKLFWILTAFLAAFFIPFSEPLVMQSIHEAFAMLSEYAREHVLLCLVPAFFIAGAISVFINQQAVIRYLGPEAKKWVAYAVSSVSGSILAVCSCTVLPLFKGIYKRGAGLGPAVAFLYSGPAVNVLAIILTAKVLGFKLGVARGILSVAFSVIIGFLMHLIFKKEDAKRVAGIQSFSGTDEGGRKLYQNVLHLLSMMGILIFVNWAPGRGEMGFAWDFIFQSKYFITAGFLLALFWILWRWFKKDEIKEWAAATRDFSLQILPLLFAGVLAAGFLLGRPGHEALLPQNWVASLVGGNSIFSNFLASLSGALMYFATLTEVPILQGLLGSGMGQGPALALLLAGPSLSLPSILVIKGELGLKKTVTYVALVVFLSTAAGWAYGALLA